ncbi:MAG: hypothetical protein U9R15_05940 [Chloroflexota bacterium]|nr:hypothetical protein [Chloroflexota bacterium]
MQDSAFAQQSGETFAQSSHIDHLHNQIHDESTGMFGFFETADDYAVAQALLATARDWVRRWGMATLRGPLSFSQNHECGALIEGDAGPPTLMMSYNPRCYVEFYERFGLSKAMDMYAYLFDLTQFGGDAGKLPPRLIRLAEKVRERTRATMRSFNEKTLVEDIQKIKEIYNQAWKENWGFTPLTNAEADKMAVDLLRIYDPALVVGVEVMANRPAYHSPFPTTTRRSNT